MNKLISVVFVISMIVGCNKPVLVMQGDMKYKTVEWDGGLFVYVTYYWKGGKFEDAVHLEKQFVTWAQEKGISRQAIGRFPTSREWQLGFIADTLPDTTVFQGYKIETMQIPSGTYASMLGKGHPENMFFYWKKFKKWLIQDRYKIESPVFEMYNDLLNDSIPELKQVGEIRYNVLKLL